MNCHTYDDVLDDYVNGARSASSGGPDTRLSAFESHLAGCARCQALVADFTSIRRAAAALDEHVPPARLWAKVAGSIDQRERQRWWHRPLQERFPVWIPVALAASLAILVGGSGWLMSRVDGTGSGADVAAPAAEATVRPAEQHYDEAIAGLQRIADAQTAALDPGTRAVLQDSLAVIDRAIGESRAALAAEPASALAQESLLDVLDTKVALLQDTVALAGELGERETSPAAAEDLHQ